MIVRKIKQDTEAIIQSFDWFNDYSDTRKWVIRNCPEVLEQFDAGFAKYNKEKTMKNETVEAEIVEDEFKAPVLRDAKELTTLVNVESLLKEYAEIPDIDPESENAGEQYQYVLKGHREFVKARTSIEKARKAIGQPAFAFHKKCIEIEKEVLSQIMPTEHKLFAARNLVEDNEKRKIQEAEYAEELRVKTINDAISQIKNAPLSVMGMGSGDIENAVEKLIGPTIEKYEEFFDEAMVAYAASMQSLMMAKEQALKAEQADKILAKQKAKADAEEAERQAKLKADRENLEAEQSAFREEQRKSQEAIRVQQEEINRQNAAREAEELAKRQADEQIKRDAEEKMQRIEKDKQDKKLLKKRMAEAARDIKDAINDNANDADNTYLIQAIIDGCIAHVRWSPENV